MNNPLNNNEKTISRGSEEPFIELDKNNPPVFVYQMGKVGSKTIAKSLEQSSFKGKIFHAHQLSNAGFESIISWHKSLGIKDYPPQLIYYGQLRKSILKYWNDMTWQIITMTREPVGRNISSIFENIKWTHPHLFNENGEIRTLELIDIINDQFNSFQPESDYTNTWFDKELKDVFGIDVYSESYDFKNGYNFFKDGNVEVLIIRLEDFQKSLEEALMNFLNLKNINILKGNVGEEKYYNESYEFVKKNLRFEEKLLKKILSTKYSNHFYLESEKKQILDRWKI